MYLIVTKEILEEIKYCSKFFNAFSHNKSKNVSELPASVRLHFLIQEKNYFVNFAWKWPDRKALSTALLCRVNA